MNDDLISRPATIDNFFDELDEIFADIRERHVDDSVCGLCEYDGAYIGQSGDWCNECPGFEKDDCFKLSDKIRKEWTDEIIKALPSAQPERQHGRIFQEIVVEYPSYCIYPEYKGKPYFSIKYTENGQEFIGYGTYKPEVLSKDLKEYFMPSAQPEANEVARDIATIIENEKDMRVIQKNAEQKWIPCSERLPECEQEVLICTKKKTVGKNAYIDSIITPAIYEDGTMLENNSKWGWEDIDYAGWDEEEDCGIIPEGWWENRHFYPDGDYNSVVDQEVVAWMPLPEPYKGEYDG